MIRSFSAVLGSGRDLSSGEKKPRALFWMKKDIFSSYAFSQSFIFFWLITWTARRMKNCSKERHQSVIDLCAIQCDEAHVQHFVPPADSHRWNIYIYAMQLLLMRFCIMDLLESCSRRTTVEAQHCTQTLQKIVHVNRQNQSKKTAGNEASS